MLYLFIEVAYYVTYMTSNRREFQIYKVELTSCLLNKQIQTCVTLVYIFIFQTLLLDIRSKGLFSYCKAIIVVIIRRLVTV